LIFKLNKTPEQLTACLTVITWL